VFLGLRFSRKNAVTSRGESAATHPPSLTTFLIRVESLARHTRHFIQPKKKTQPSSPRRTRKSSSGRPPKPKHQNQRHRAGLFESPDYSSRMLGCQGLGGHGTSGGGGSNGV
jgi:hypothetical protein